MKKATILLLVLLPAVGFSQTTFERTYGGTAWDEAYDVRQTSDGGYIIAGYTVSYGAGSFDCYLIKTDANGDTLWTRTYGGEESDQAYAVQQTSDGGYILGGFTGSFGQGEYDFYLVKTDSNGDTMWTRTFGGTEHDIAYGVQQTSDGGYIIAGYSDSYDPNYSDYYAIKTDADGDSLWGQTYGGTSDEKAYAVWQTVDGGYLFVGYTYGSGAGANDFYLVRADGSGNVVWAETYGGTSNDIGRAVQQTSDGGYVLAGQTDSFGAGGSDYYVVKTDGGGSVDWTAAYGGIFYDRARDIHQTADGGYIVVGYSNSYGAGDGDLYLVRTDENGDTLWTRTYGEEDTEMGEGVRQTSDGGYIAVGYQYDSATSDRDIYVVKTDENGMVSVTSLEERAMARPFRLGRSRPNPFNRLTTITYELPRPVSVRLTIYNCAGQEVRTLLDREQPAGQHQVVWDGRDNSGMRVGSGLYFQALEAGGHSEVRKMLVLK